MPGVVSMGHKRPPISLDTKTSNPRPPDSQRRRHRRNHRTKEERLHSDDSLLLFPPLEVSEQLDSISHSFHQNSPPLLQELNTSDQTSDPQSHSSQDSSSQSSSQNIDGTSNSDLSIKSFKPSRDSPHKDHSYLPTDKSRERWFIGNSAWDVQQLSAELRDGHWIALTIEGQL